MSEEWEGNLTPKQRMFVREYIVDLNATQAAIRAGYSERTANEQASRLLANVNVGAAVTAAMNARSRRTQITADRVLKELAKIGFADIRKAVSWDRSAATEAEGEGSSAKTTVANVQLVASADIDDDTAAAIAEISQNANGGLRLKLHDKRAALVDIGKHLGMFTERVQLTGDADNPVHIVERRIVRPIDRDG